MELTRLRLDDLAALRWAVRPEPLLSPPWPSPIIADPTFLAPGPGRPGWHLWAHSLLGVHHFTGEDGITWRRRETVVRNALRADILDLRCGPDPWREWPDRYRLTYERTRIFLPLGGHWSSGIESRRSADLATWTPPTRLLEPSLPWHESPSLGRAVSNPCLIPDDDGWRLYYSAGLTFLPDCGFSEPTAIGVAHADSPDGPFQPDPQPVLGPDDDYASLAAGAMKVIRVADGWAAFQNAITWDGTHSGSNIWLLGSADGLAWQRLMGEPVIAPAGTGWMSTHVYALDVRDTPNGPRLFFNARDGYHWTKGRERIGIAFPG